MNNKEEYIRTVIREEYLSFMKEAALCHNKDTGHFDKCSAGNTYSISDKGAKAAGIDSKWVKRGTLTKSKPRGSVPVTRASFGLNSQNKSGGRIKMTSGEKITPKLSVSKYPKPYKEGLKEASLAMAQWVASQDGASDKDGLIDETSDCDCRSEKRASYQAGLNSSLEFIRSYEQSKKGD
tara:strand:+ start:262 stop:801 length:540 start_codon:yes stop_codon:yes gene_type:complete